jgi:predicted SAM-dependent methyltransferase
VVTTKTRSNGKTETTIHAPRKLDIACGQRKQPGFKGIDIAGDADILHDLNEIPWPIKTSSVREAFCSHYVEHIPHYRPGWDRDGWWIFFDELHRVMAKGGTIDITHPYVHSSRAFWDPTHVRFISEVTWYYLDADWRRSQGLDHYDVSCNFEVVTIDGIGIPDDFLTKNYETQAFQRTHYWNVIPDLRVLLKARK